MEVFVRRDGSLKIKLDGDGIVMGFRLEIEGEDREEKTKSAMALFERVNKKGSVIGTAYQLRDGEFKPVRRGKDGNFVESPVKNWIFVSKEELLEWVKMAGPQEKEILREAAIRIIEEKKVKKEKAATA